MNAATFDYVRDPAEISRRSVDAIRAECDLSRIPPDLSDLALRLVHACAMPDIVNELAWSQGAGATGRAALSAGAPLLVDVEMVAQGIIRAALPANNAVICTLNDETVPEQSRRRNTTRSAAAVDLWADRLEGSVVAIGNAPTALFRLLEILAGGGPPPALILGFPVGFIGAAESKDALIADSFGVPFVTLRGRFGGSALAAAAVNALASGAPG